MERYSHSEVSLFAPDGARKYLVQSERQAFISAAVQCDPATRLLCEILTFTGCRLSEALRLRPSDIDLGAQAITFRTLKQRSVIRYRQVPVPTDLIQRLSTWVRCKPNCNAPIFAVHRQTGWRWIRHTMQSAGLTGVRATSRGLRHGFAIAAIEALVPQTVIQKWLGHASLKTTAIYSQVVGAEERQLAERVWACTALMS